MAYFLPFDNAKRPQIVRDFFTILMEARLALGMPVLVASEDGRAIGAVMGYDTTRLEWQPQHARKFVDLEAKHPGLPERFARADHVMAEFRPSLLHHYLGVVGVSSEAQGRGVGRSLINSFLSLSEKDVQSLGTFLETANSRNVPYYESMGFQVLGERQIGPATSLWCLFKAK